MYFLLCELFVIFIALWTAKTYALVIAAVVAGYLISVRMLEKITVPSLHNRPVLITGCRAGFGYDLSMRCLRMGMPVFAAFHSNRGREAFEADAAEIPHADRLLHTLILDVTDEASIDAARQFVEDRLHLYGGQLWGLVNNAGVVGTGWDDYVTAKDYEWLLQVNTLGVIRVTHAFKDLIKQSRGRIIIMSSVMGKIALPLFSTYSVAKFALNAFTDCLRIDMARFGVSVIGIEAGFFVTPLADVDTAIGKLESLWRTLPEERRAEYPEEHMRWTQKLIDTFRHIEDIDISKVTEVYVSSLISAFPRACWLVGRDAVFVFGPLSLLPTRMVHAVLRFFNSYLMGEPKVQAPVKYCAIVTRPETTDVMNTTTESLPKS